MDASDREPAEAAVLQQVARCPPPERVPQGGDVVEEDVGPHDAEPEGDEHRLPTGRQQESDDRHVITPAAETEQVRLPAQGIRVETEGDVDKATVCDALGDWQLVGGQRDGIPLQQEYLVLEDVAAAHDRLVVEGQELFLIQIASRAFGQPGGNVGRRKRGGVQGGIEVFRRQTSVEGPHRFLVLRSVGDNSKRHAGSSFIDSSRMNGQARIGRSAKEKTYSRRSAEDASKPSLE